MACSGKKRDRMHIDTGHIVRKQAVRSDIFSKLFFVRILFVSGGFGSAFACAAAQANQTTQESVAKVPPNAEISCVETDQIASYKVESDEIVRLALKNRKQIILRLKRHCPQLHFHRYISYTPVDGRICAGSDEIKTRAGLACRIGSFTPVPPAEQTAPIGAATSTP